jgi:twinkle protein
MARMIPADTIDFGAYEDGTEEAQKVRRAQEFIDDLMAEFRDRESGKRSPSMFSTKARHFIEFRPGEVTAWAGFNGHRKSMFTSQVALDLCVQRERVLLASFEMTPGKTLARMVRQASGSARPSDAQMREFAQWSNGRLWLFDHMGRVTPKQCLGLCRYFADELKGTHIVIDSMMMVCASEEHLDEQKQFVTDLCRTAQETGLHIHLVTHCRKPQSGEQHPPTKYDIRGAAAISDQVANVVTIWANKPKRDKLEANPGDEEALQQPDARISVEKQRNGAWEGKLRMWFDEASLRFIDDRTSQVQAYDLQEAL